MPEPKAFHRFAQVARRWRDLIDRRSAHFVDLHRSGRWRLYYSEAEFLALLREAVKLAEAWADIAPAPGVEGKVPPTEAPEIPRQWPAA
jgi:uncharacterized repeat protein (TIGR03809 family)